MRSVCESWSRLSPLSSVWSPSATTFSPVAHNSSWLFEIVCWGEEGEGGGEGGGGERRLEGGGREKKGGDTGSARLCGVEVNISTREAGLPLRSYIRNKVISRAATPLLNKK